MTSTGFRADVLSEIRAEIEEVERELIARVSSDVDLVARIARHTLDGGGKRLRPALVALCARAVGSAFDSARTRALGAALEMVHMATLVHDDVIDHAGTRRGRVTAASAFGNTPAILTGDVLLARAMAILAEDGDLEVIRCVSNAVVQLAEGEVRELELRGLFNLAEEEHLRVLEMKTASFIACCCEVGALIGQATASERTALTEFGWELGLAFQIVDDVLDYQGLKTGKPRATDFREGCATLPLILLRPLLSPAESEDAMGWFGNGASEEDIARIAAWMQERGCFDLALGRAKQLASRAADALASLRRTPAVETLLGVADYVVAREV